MESALPECTWVYANTPEQGGVWLRDPPGGNKEPTTDPDWGANSINYLDNLVATQGPFYGILGYSQGSAMIPVYLAQGSGTFNRAMMYCGYLPDSHQGIMGTINAASPFDTTAMVFSATNDVFGPYAPAQAAVFSNVVHYVSQTAGHALPGNNDSQFDNTVQFIRAGLA